jgi:hypothetical protein
MLKIEFPKDKIVVRQTNGGKQIFDIVRKKWLKLSAEEWVRQHVIHYLVEQGYPSSLMAIEKQIMVSGLVKRCDIVIYRRDTIPFMIIECKKMDVQLNSDTLDQVLRYHISVPAQYLLITNGRFTYCFEKKQNRFVEINHFPGYKER